MNKHFTELMIINASGRYLINRGCRHGYLKKYVELTEVALQSSKISMKSSGYIILNRFRTFVILELMKKIILQICENKMTKVMENISRYLINEYKILQALRFYYW